MNAANLAGGRYLTPRSRLASRAGRLGVSPLLHFPVLRLSDVCAGTNPFPYVALYLNRRLWSFTALNSWTGSQSIGFNSWPELHLNRGLPRERVYDLSTAQRPKFRLKSVYELSAV